MLNLKIHTNRLILLIVLFQLINISVQAHPANETLLANSFQDKNRIDNAIEFILEIVLHKKDAIPEDKHPKQDHAFHAKYVDFKLVIPQYHYVEPTTFIVLKGNKHFPSYVLYENNYSTEINPPPPKSQVI